ncbi:chloride channel protein [Limosilactobacillus albertensis]|uniref:Chloride channel protein n=1 Tax=Limosilactobacillus albertensis TaxID=2759752 RepID=A0A839HD85_9LACO|nr:chloride channel protein [Limosilactobacillus albertensis]MBB1124272.1 chloride channel protein [Limosilactobacillus albertensis]MCD7121936.1 chloride channel protein [Limosilactobacillus albertensis]
MKHWRAQLGIYAILWSLIIGMVTAGYLNLVNWVIDFIWADYLQYMGNMKIWYPFVVCVPLGFLIGYLNKKWGNYPLTIEEVLTSVRLKGNVDYHKWWKSFLLGLLVLGAGGSVGPEASTTVLTSSMINWLGDRLRWSTFMAQQSAANIWRDKMTPQQLASAPRFNELFHSKRERILSVSLLVIIGILGAAIIFKMFPEEGVFGIHHRQINWQWINVLTAVPAFLVGCAFGRLFVRCENWSALIVDTKLGKVWQGGIFGLVLAFSSLLTGDILFSGEFRIVPFTHEAFSLSISFLLIIAVVKAIMTNLGFAMGWRGGTIFPAIFASVPVGVACAMALPGDMHINAVVVLATSLTVILEKPILTIIVLVLLIAIELAPVVVVICFLTGFLIKKIPQIR